MGGVWGVVTTADGRLVVGGGQDGTVRAWDVATGHVLATVPGHSGGARGVALSKDGALAASVFHSGAIAITDLKRDLAAAGIEVRP